MFGVIWQIFPRCKVFKQIYKDSSHERNLYILIFDYSNYHLEYKPDFLFLKQKLIKDYQ